MALTKTLSPLNETVSTTGTDLWNDSCSIQELTYAIGHGAVGATSNPTIVLGVLKKELPAWRERIRELIAQNTTWSESEIAWQLVEEMAAKGAALLRPVFDREKGKKGRLSIQTNPTFYRNPEAIVKQALHFHSLAPNIQVKAPATKAGIRAIEEATYQGVSINATVCFSLPQAIEVAEAVERGLNRRTSEKLDNSTVAPVCTLMIGRLDRLVEGGSGQRKDLPDAWASRLGRHRGHEEGIWDFSGSRLPGAPAGRCVPSPYALVGADWRRHRADDSL